MEKIGRLIDVKKSAGLKRWDEKSLFYAFQRVIKAEYGNRGLMNLTPEFYKDGKIFVRSLSSVWSNEIMLSQREIVAKINQELGQDEITSIKIKK